jgi:hypothetical protein
MTDTESKEVELKSCPIKSVYEKYKHYDNIFVDMDEHSGDYLKTIMSDFWRAIREFNTKRSQANNAHKCQVCDKEAITDQKENGWRCQDHALFGKDNSGHAGDCTVYSSMQNNHITDGICTCGYGHRQQTSESFAMDNMYSQERISEGLERKDNSGMVPRKEYLMCSTHQVGIMPNRLCGYCELERLSQQPPKERKVSLEEISKILICLHEVTGEVYLGNITGTSQSILSLLNATEERKGA